MAYAFLSEEWFTAVEDLRGEAPEPPEVLKGVVINITVTEAPSGDVALHFDSGQLAREHAEAAPTRVTAPYELARALFVEGNQAAAMQAFMAGKIRVDGDMSKIMVVQTVVPTPEQEAFARRLFELTS